MDGQAEAMVRVGHMLLSGYGVKQDPTEAAKWLRQAWCVVAGPRARVWCAAICLIAARA